MVDPRMLTDSVPAPCERCPLVGMVLKDIWDHLWPWSHHGFQRQRAIQAASVALALAATTMWVLAATGRIEAIALISWWFGWSVFEVIVRMGSKPYVKDGPWWRWNYRKATLMDMICYVGFKNLLIGAALFIALKTLGLLVL